MEDKDKDGEPIQYHSPTEKELQQITGIHSNLAIADEILDEATVAAAQMLADTVTSDDVPLGMRLKAATFIISLKLGKAPAASSGWERLVTTLAVDRE